MRDEAIITILSKGVVGERSDESRGGNHQAEATTRR